MNSIFKPLSIMGLILILTACGDQSSDSAAPSNADDGNNTTDTSNPVAPTVTLTSPGNNSSFLEGATININANASDTDGSIRKVVIFDDGVRLVTLTAAPYTFNWTGAAVGRHSLHAVAHDNDGHTRSSNIHRVNVNRKLIDPTIELISPTESAVFTEGADIPISINASDDDGSIRKVDVYDNGSLLTQLAAAPYVFNWSGATLGNHDIHAVVTDNDGLTSESATHRITVSEEDTSGNTGTLITYPADETLRQKFKSDRFAVRLIQSGVTKDTFVYQSNNDAEPGWVRAKEFWQTANHWTTFSFDGSVAVEARRIDGKAVQTCVVRPLSLKIQPQIIGNTCRFTLENPAKVSVEIDENERVSYPFDGREFKDDSGNILTDKGGTLIKHIVKHPLLVFADPLEVDPPSASDTKADAKVKVIHYGPGLHNIGKSKKLENNTQVYIAGGAYVTGNFVAPQENPTNITIRGRGILSGIGLVEGGQEASWTNHAISFSSGHHKESSGLRIEGITITDPLRACINSYSPVDIQNVKLLSWKHRNDGISVGDGSQIENSFLKVMDDNIKLYRSNQTIRHNVIWQQTSGAVFKFAWNLKSVVQGNRVEHIDIIHSDVYHDFMKFEPDRPDMHSTSAIFSAMGFQKSAAFKKNTFNWIRIEEENLLRLMSLRMVSTHKTPSGDTSTWGDPSEDAEKTISNIEFNNIQLAGVPYKQSTLYGNKGGVIENLRFTNLKVNGNVVGSEAALTSRIDGIGLLTAGNVSDISFSQ